MKATCRQLFRWMLRVVCLAAPILPLFAQNPGKYHITLRGTAYERDATGNLVPAEITEKTLLEEAAQARGLTNLNSLALVYHVRGSSFGDTIDLVEAATGAPITSVLGFFFGEDRSLNRTAITNAPGTMIKRIDYLYTRQNSHSMGTGFVTRRNVADVSGNVRVAVDGGQLQWIVLPENGRSARMCRATFTTTRAFP